VSEEHITSILTNTAILEWEFICINDCLGWRWIYLLFTTKRDVTFDNNLGHHTERERERKLTRIDKSKKWIGTIVFLNAEHNTVI